MPEYESLKHLVQRLGYHVDVIASSLYPQSIHEALGKSSTVSGTYHFVVLVDSVRASGRPVVDPYRLLPGILVRFSPSLQLQTIAIPALTVSNEKMSVATPTAAVAGLRKNGKQWHEPKKAFRPTSGQTSYAKRVARESQAAEVKKVENEMKGEKEQERQVGALLQYIRYIDQN